MCLRCEGPSIGLDDHRHLCGATWASVGTPERTAHVGTKHPPPEAGCPAPPVYAKQYSTQEAGKGRQDVQQREPTERTCQHSSPRGCTRSVASTAGSPRACACLRTRFTVHMLLSLNSKPIVPTQRVEKSRLVITRYTNLTIRVPANRMMSPSDRRVHRSAALALGRHRLYVIDTGLCEAPSIAKSLSARVV